MKWMFFSLALVLSQSAVADVSTEVDIVEPFARSALQSQRNSAVFMQVVNQGKAAAIISASSPVAKVVELHTHSNDNGVMRMRKIERIDLPAGQTVELRPGGLHVMLIGLQQDLKVGEEITLTLEFDDGSRRQLAAPVHKVMRHHKMMQMQ